MTGSTYSMPFKAVFETEHTHPIFYFYFSLPKIPVAAVSGLRRAPISHDILFALHLGCLSRQLIIVLIVHLPSCISTPIKSCLISNCQCFRQTSFIFRCLHLQAENVGKPKITEQICGAGGLESPAVVASRAIHDILIGRRRSFVGFMERILGWATAGVSRVQEDFPPFLPPPFVFMLEILLAPFFKIALFIFAYYCRGVILYNQRRS